MGLDTHAWDTIRDDIRSRVSVPDLLQQSGIHTVKAGGGLKFLHHGEKTPSAHAYHDHYHCHGCGAHGDVFDLWIELHGGDQGDALTALAAQSGVRLPEQTPEARAKAEAVARVRDLVQLVQDAAHTELRDASSDAAKVAFRWLIGRGIRRETAIEAGLGVIPSWDRCVRLIAEKGEGGIDAGLRSGLLRQRESDGKVYDALHHTVTFPVRRSGAGKAVTLIGRTGTGLLEDDRRKAKTLKLTTDETTAPDAPESPRLWWPAPVVGDQVFLVEGEIDALTLAQAGFPVAALLSAGAARDPRTADELVSGHPGRVVLMLPDRDKAGRDAARAMAAHLGDRLRIVEPWTDPESADGEGAIKDPNDALQHHVRAAGGDVAEATGRLKAEVTAAADVAPLWLLWETARLVAENGSDRARLGVAVRKSVMPALVAVTDRLVRSTLLDEIARATGLGKRDLAAVAKGVEAENERARRAAEAGKRPDPNDPDPTKRPFELGDHTELARRLLEILEADGIVPTVYDRGDLYRYDQHRGIWEPLQAAHAMAVLDAFSGMPLIKRRDEETGDVDYEPLRMTDTATRGAWAAATRARHAPGFFDDAPPGLAFPNGYLTLSREGDVRFGDHAPEHRATVRAACEWRPGTAAPQWFGFLRRVWAGCTDIPDRIRSVHEFAGLALFGEATSYQKCLVLPGPRAGNGKSSFQDVLSAMFPSTAKTSVVPQDWNKDAHLAALVPSRWNVCGELPRGSIAHADRFNAVVDGSPITVNPKYKHAFTYRPRAAHIFACNTLPTADNENEGFWRRLIVIDFPNTFRKGDPNFVLNIADHIIEAELPAVYEACVMAAADVLGRRGTLESGITEPASAADNLERWRIDGDTVRQWLEERCETQETIAASSGVDDAKLFTATRLVWLDYLEWAKEANVRHTYSKITFGRRMGQLGLTARSRDDGRGYAVRLRPREGAGLPWGAGAGSGGAGGGMGGGMGGNGTSSWDGRMQ